MKEFLIGLPILGLGVAMMSAIFKWIENNMQSFATAVLYVWAAVVVIIIIALFVAVSRMFGAEILNMRRNKK